LGWEYVFILYSKRIQTVAWVFVQWPQKILESRLAGKLVSLLALRILNIIMCNLWRHSLKPKHIKVNREQGTGSREQGAGSIDFLEEGGIA
jgi:hypothetical protein